MDESQISQEPDKNISEEDDVLDPKKRAFLKGGGAFFALALMNLACNLPIGEGRPLAEPEPDSKTDEILAATRQSLRETKDRVVFDGTPEDKGFFNRVRESVLAIATKNYHLSAWVIDVHKPSNTIAIATAAHVAGILEKHFDRSEMMLWRPGMDKWFTYATAESYSYDREVAKGINENKAEYFPLDNAVVRYKINTAKSPFPDGMKAIPWKDGYEMQAKEKYIMVGFPDMLRTEQGYTLQGDMVSFEERVPYGDGFLSKCSGIFTGTGASGSVVARMNPENDTPEAVGIASVIDDEGNLFVAPLDLDRWLGK